MENIKKIIDKKIEEVGKSFIFSGEYEECQDPLDLEIIDLKSISAKLFFALDTTANILNILVGEWWNQHRFKIHKESLDDIEKYLYWLATKCETISNKDENIYQMWMTGQLHTYRSLYILNKIKSYYSTKKPEYGVVIYKFNHIHELSELGMFVRDSLECAYDLRKYENELPFSFERYKFLQKLCISMCYSAAAMQNNYTDTRKKEMRKWLN